MKKINKLNLISGYLFSILLFINTAYADHYMECHVTDALTSPKASFFPHPFPNKPVIIFYWGYRPSVGLGIKGMFTSLGTKGLSFTGDPSSPTSISVNYTHCRKSRLNILGKDDVDLEDTYFFDFTNKNPTLTIKEDSNTLNRSKKPITVGVTCDRYDLIPADINVNHTNICRDDGQQPIKELPAKMPELPQNPIITCLPPQDSKIPPISWSYRGNTHEEIKKSLATSFTGEINTITIKNGIPIVIQGRSIINENQSNIFLIRSLNPDKPFDGKWEVTGQLGEHAIKGVKFGHCSVSEQDISSPTEKEVKQ